MNDIILNTIKKYEVKGDFNYASVTDDMISDAEEILDAARCSGEDRRGRRLQDRT